METKTTMTLDQFVEAHPPQGAFADNAALRMVKDFKEIAESCGASVEVVSKHRSKSVFLPVVKFSFKNGIQAIVRDNFHDIKISVLSDRPVTSSLVREKIGGANYTVYATANFEGFEDSWIFGSYDSNNKEFSGVLYSMDNLGELISELSNQFCCSKNDETDNGDNDDNRIMDLSSLVDLVQSTRGSRISFLENDLRYNVSLALSSYRERNKIEVKDLSEKLGFEVSKIKSILGNLDYEQEITLRDLCAISDLLKVSVIELLKSKDQG